MGISVRRWLTVVTTAIVVALLSAILVSCGGAQSGGEEGESGEGPIKVGVITTQTGPIAQPGQSILRGVEATADMVNAEGGR